MIYGYIRVSSDKQTVENQRFEINNFCEREQLKIDGWIEETISGTKSYNKRELGKLLNRVQKDDLIICAELSRLGRNLFMIMEILNLCMNKECRVWTIKDNYRLGDDIQSKVLAFAFGLSAEIERNLISQRTKEALARKKAEGVVLGRPKGKKTSPEKYKLHGKRILIEELLKNDVSQRQIAKICKVDRNTLARYIKNFIAEWYGPILRGRDIKRYAYEWANLWLINTHNGVKGKIERIHIEDYPAVKAHLDLYWDKISKRADKGDTPYNLRNCAYLEDFSKPKIVWGNLNIKAGYALVEDFAFVNAPSPMIVTSSKYLLAVLNSKIADYYIRLLGVTRNGGYFEYKPMFVEKIPIPKNVDESIISEIETSIAVKDEVKIDASIYNLYGLNKEEINFIENKN